MDRIVKCASCGCIDSDIGEGTVFCSGCNAALGIVKKKVIEWDTKMVRFDGFMDQVFSGKEGPQGVAEEFGGEGLNHKIAQGAIQLQVRLDELRTTMMNSNILMNLQRERITLIESDNYRLKELREDDRLQMDRDHGQIQKLRAYLGQIANSDDCGGECGPLHTLARKALEA